MMTIMIMIRALTMAADVMKDMSGKSLAARILSMIVNNLGSDDDDEDEDDNGFLPKHLVANK